MFGTARERELLRKNIGEGLYRRIDLEPFSHGS